MIPDHIKIQSWRYNTAVVIKRHQNSISTKIGYRVDLDKMSRNRLIRHIVGAFSKVKFTELRTKVRLLTTEYIVKLVCNQLPCTYANLDKPWNSCEARCRKKCCSVLALQLSNFVMFSSCIFDASTLESNLQCSNVWLMNFIALKRNCFFGSTNCVLNSLQNKFLWKVGKR